MFTVYKNELINQKIKGDMDQVTKTILSLVTNVDAIILVGGFGRGEGSVLLDGKKCQPLNDYDLVVITDEMVSEDELVEARLDLAEKCGIRQVDLSIKRRKDLASLKFTMANYDLINASFIIYGSLNLKRESPSWQASSLPKVEGVFPLFLFLSSIVLSYPKSNSMTSQEIFWAYQQTTKSILGWSTAMLVFEGLYDSSYVSRNKTFQEHFSEFPELCILVEQATNFKLRPTLDPCTYSDYLEVWNKAKETHLDVMKLLLSRYYSVEYDSWNALINRHRVSPKNIAKALLSLILRKHHYYDCLNIDIAKLYFCLSIENESLLSYSKHYLKKVKLSKTEQEFSIDREEYRQQLIMGDINARIFNERGSEIFYE